MLRSLLAVSVALSTSLSVTQQAHARTRWLAQPRVVVARAPAPTGYRWGYAWWQVPRFVGPSRPVYVAPRRLAWASYVSPPPSYAVVARPRATAPTAPSYHGSPASEWAPMRPAPQPSVPRAPRSPATQSGLVWPVDPVVISSGFGMRTDPINGEWGEHPGLDINAELGQPIGACAPGVVTRAGRVGGYGLHVEVTHADGLVTSYSHLSRILVREGAQVQAGNAVGLAGSTGHSTAPHLHFEVIRDGQKIDPLLVMPEAPQESAWR